MGKIPYLGCLTHGGNQRVIWYLLQRFAHIFPHKLSFVEVLVGVHVVPLQHCLTKPLRRMRSAILCVIPVDGWVHLLVIRDMAGQDLSIWARRVSAAVGTEADEQAEARAWLGLSRATHAYGHRCYRVRACLRGVGVGRVLSPAKTKAYEKRYPPPCSPSS